MRKKSERVLAIISTFNPNDMHYDESFEDFSHPWFDTIRSWQIQRSEDLHVDIVVADNVSGSKTRRKLIEFQKQEKDFYIDFIDDFFTTPCIGFNHAISLFKDKNKYDYFAYCASDASFQNKGDLRTLLNDMDENCCLIHPQADSDMCQRFDFDKEKAPTRIHLGEGVNMHICLWTREFMEAFNYKYIDILGGPRSESLYPFLCSSIKCHEFLSHRVCIHHIGRHDRYYTQPLLVPNYKRDFYERINKGTELGLGFEECLQDKHVYENIFLNQPRLSHFKSLIVKYAVLNPTFKHIFDTVKIRGVLPKQAVDAVDKAQGKPYYHKHNPNCFDENEYAKTDALYHFINEHLFLKESELDYKKITFRLYGGDNK